MTTLRAMGGGPEHSEGPSGIPVDQRSGCLDRALLSVPPLFPRARIAADLIEAGQLVQDEPDERGTDAALAVGRPDLGRVGAAGSHERDHLVDAAERTFLGQQVDEAALPGARDVASSLG